MMAVLKKNSIQEKIDTKSLIAVIEANTVEYGEHVIQQRAVPDYRDGFKPVARRALWTAFEDIKMRSNGIFYKSARLVGDVMGRYHPHGDSAIYEAIVNMVNLPVSQFQKTGNFGYVANPKYAAMRYTEIKLSEYGQNCFFNPYLQSIVDMIPSYDGHNKEPLYLPATFPNLLLNGTSGIAVGITCDIPPLHIDSLMPFIDKAINGEEFTAIQLAQKLRFNWKYGSRCVNTQQEIANWIKNGSQSLWFEPEFQLNAIKRTITITEAPPNFNYEKVVESLLGEDKKTKKRKYEFVTSVDNECKSDKKTGKETICFVVKLKNTIDPDEFSNYAKKVINEFTNYVKTQTNVTYRSTDKVKFIDSSIPDLIGRWSSYRVGLEKKIIKHRIAEIEKNLETKDLMLLAIKHRKDIFASLEKTNPYNYVEEKLKITKEQANTVLHWGTISLANLSKEKVISEKDDLLLKRSRERKTLANPQPKVLSDMSDNMKFVK